MLDDLKYIHQKDAHDALGIVSKQADQLRLPMQLKGVADFGTVSSVVYAGMGGSALAGLLLHTWPGLPVPFELVRDYTLPAYVGKDTLCIIASYSGNTEEALSALSDAEQKGARIAIIASGGKLEELATQKHYPFAALPKVDQPRYCMLANFKALLVLLETAGLLHTETVQPEIVAAADFVEQAIQAWLPTIPTARNPAKQLAQELLGKSVVIYGGPNQYPAAYKWKISINENAKQIAWTGQLPEFNHNEFLGWTEQPIDKPYAVVDLRSDLEHPRVQKRFVVSARMLSGKRPEPLMVEAQGDSVLEHLLWTIAYGDFVSIYLGLLNGLNPAPVELVEAFKREMAA
ncbi:MAG TPA: bifunctional phosphoglucose/phosphomannose isomerase [Candidatus Saccharimonadales bacterium]|nr:bifunctional phosphoglucose/phosphomannose isomerase [Candidatus Saccharimonadales bacterium]